MKFRFASLSAMATLAFSVAQATTARTLDIYFIDVEGGQSTLLVTPDGQSLLIDTGYAGNGMTDAKPGNPKQARDPNRIVAAARDSGIKQIDYLLITHFHRDHDGGVPELAQLMPIRNFIDHGTIPPDADSGARGSMQAFNVYAAVRDNAHHIEPKPGDRLPLQSVDAVVVSSAASILANPLAGAGETNAACGPSSLPPDDSIENPRSTGVVVSFGKFRFLDVGDLSGQPLFGLACPKDLIGPVGVYVVAHHGGADIADPATFTAFRPRIALMNNGLKKGGALETYALLHHVRGLEDVWQLHRSEASGEENFPAEHIANLDESTAYWIKLSASEDGSFRVFNGRTGEWKSYPPR